MTNLCDAEAICLEPPPVGHFDERDRLCVTTLRTLAMDAVQQANSGHPGMPMGMAIGERWLATRFNRPGFEIVNHYTYVIVSDGDMMEGVSHEACSLAGHLGLGKLIVLYDDNGITIDGPTSLAFSEDVLARFAAYGWTAQRVDGHDAGAVLNAIAPRLPTLIGGSADLTPSNNTLPKDERSLTRDDFSGRYIHFGVREHGMGSILNGIALHGEARPYGGTFLIFSDYMRPAIRLAALMELPIIFVFTHDSIGLGEDGPTHQPIEHLTSLRAIPNMAVFRPADAAETVVGWRVALGRKHGPTALVLTRQAVPVLDRARYASAEGAALGAYVLADSEDPQVILIATGSEVHLAIETQRLLAAQNVRARVVSMPCRELFEAQPTAYQESVLPPRLRARVTVEAGATLAWGRYVGLDGAVVGLDRFGASAPYQEIYRQSGLTAEAVVAAARRVIADWNLEISHKKLGTYGAPEGLLSAIIARATNSEMKTILRPHTDKHVQEWKQMGNELGTVMDKEDLVSGEHIGFVATAIGGNQILRGLRIENQKAQGNTILVTKKGSQIESFEKSLKES